MPPDLSPLIPANDSSCAEGGKLYLVATPIGNLDDTTVRAAAILATCDTIACEDTRKTQRLLQRLNIEKPLIPYHEHNEKQQAGVLVDMLTSGKSVALVSEAGTPGISDPGFRVTRECRKRDIPVVPLPGSSALVAALSASGLPSDGFLFVGFLPPKKSARRTFLERHRDFPYTLIFYESCHRIEKFMEDIVEVLGTQRTIGIARELTKLHETFIVGTADSVKEKLAVGSKKGEFVILVAKEGFEL